MCFPVADSSIKHSFCKYKNCVLLAYMSFPNVPNSAQWSICSSVFIELVWPNDFCYKCFRSQEFISKNNLLTL